jgi:hypothetical protein
MLLQIRYISAKCGCFGQLWIYFVNGWSSSMILWSSTGRAEIDNWTDVWSSSRDVLCFFDEPKCLELIFVSMKRTQIAQRCCHVGFIFAVSSSLLYKNTTIKNTFGFVLYYSHKRKVKSRFELKPNFKLLNYITPIYATEWVNGKKRVMYSDSFRGSQNFFFSFFAFQTRLTVLLISSSFL